MPFTRRHTEDDAMWTRAWTADTLQDLVSISGIKGSERPHHGDVAFVASEGKYYLWMDDDTWQSVGAGQTPQLPAFYDYREGVPANPAADTMRLYAVDFNGFTFLEERDSAGRIIRPNRDTVAVGRVNEVGGIARGEVVRVSGATGAVRLLRKALATDRANTPGVGLAMDSGAQNAFIRVLTSGLLGQLNTSGFPEGARVFLSAVTPGALTVTAPIAPNLIQRMGYILRQHATQGEIAVIPATALSESGWEATHATMHQVGGRDPLTALDAGILTTGTVADARLSSNVVIENAANTFTENQTIAKTNPTLFFVDSSQPVDAKLFQVVNGFQTFRISAVNDAGTVDIAQPLSLSRGGDVVVGRDIYEKGRFTAVGHWQDVPFNAANFFVATGSGTWTVGAAAILRNRYTLVGKTLHWSFYVSWFSGSNTLSGTVTSIGITVPGGLTVTGAQFTSIYGNDGGVRLDMDALAATTRVEISKQNGTAFTAGSPGFIGTVTFEIT